AGEMPGCRALPARSDSFCGFCGTDDGMHLEIDDVAPLGHPLIQELRVVRFQELIAALKVRIHPTGDVRKTCWREPSPISKSPMDRNSVATPEALDHHV